MARIHELARDWLSKLGHHGEMGAMGVPRKDLPHWDDIQILPAQMARKPLLDATPVATSVTLGLRAAKPLSFDIPLFVLDIRYGALSEEAKTALARGTHLDRKTGRDVSLVITGGLRMAEGFVKAMALGAEAIAVSHSAMQAVGCIAARMCNSNKCPVGVATQKPELRLRLDVQVGRASCRICRCATSPPGSVKWLISAVLLLRVCGADW